MGEAHEPLLLAEVTIKETSNFRNHSMCAELLHEYTGPERLKSLSKEGTPGLLGSSRLNPEAVAWIPKTKPKTILGAGEKDLKACAADILCGRRVECVKPGGHEDHSTESGIEQTESPTALDQKKDPYKPLAVPVLPLDVSLLGASSDALYPLSMFPELLDLPSGLDESLRNINQASSLVDLHGASTEEPTLLWQLVATEMTLDDNRFLLPPVNVPSQLPQGVDTSTYLSDGAALTTILADCAGAACVIVRRAVAGAALYLDWSFSCKEASLRPKELVDACLRVLDMLKPMIKACKDCGGGSDMHSSLLWYHTPEQAFADLLAPFALVTVSSRPRPRRSAPRVSNMTESARTIGITAPECSRPLRDNASSYLTDCVDAQSVAKEKRTTARNYNGRRMAGGLAFYMQLRKKADVAFPAADKRDRDGRHTPRGSAVSDDFWDEGVVGDRRCSLHRVQSVETVSMKLGHHHLEVLSALQTNDATLVQQHLLTLENAKNATFPDFPSLEGLHSLLSRVHEGSAAPKAVGRALAVCAVLRQTAQLVIQHGIRAAHYYFRISCEELPGVFSSTLSTGSGNSSSALALAFAQVEVGKAEDHPKQTSLRRLLMVATTLVSVSILCGPLTTALLLPQ